MPEIRYDRAPLKAKCTDEGFLVDIPVLGRTGIQEYRRADGTIRRELRLPEEVFNPDSLASFAGKPITDDHPAEPVTSANAKKLTVGTITGKAEREGDNVVAPIVVHDGAVIDKAMRGGKRELSLGYSLDLDETPGEWEGQQYDAVQRNIRVNHLAIVAKGRAGNARLNMDGAESVEPKEMTAMSDKQLSRVRLDNGLEYEAAPEVAAALTQVRADSAELKTKLDAMTAKCDAAEAERDGLKAEVAKIPQIKMDAEAAAIVAVKARAALEVEAGKFKVDCAAKTDREIKEACIKSVRADADLTGKSDDYVQAAYDLAVSMRADSAAASQRASGVNTDSKDQKPANSYAAYKAALGKKE